MQTRKPGRLFRALLGGALACFSLAAASSDLILEATGGQAISRVELATRLAAADYLLLGEIHDNPAHHRARAGLIRDLPATFRHLVLEQVDRGQRVDGNLPVEEALDRAGFSRKGWGWPLHEPVLGAARERGMSLLGGNLDRKSARQVAKEGRPALDAELSRLVEAAPLAESARLRLEANLVEGHCGKLPAVRLSGMALAQRARDASLARTLTETGGPAVLIAGNGHVRRDYGVPAILAGAAPGARVASVGFLELGPGERPDPETWRGLYDYVWFTPPATREDPCLGLTLP